MFTYIPPHTLDKGMYINYSEKAEKGGEEKRYVKRYS